MKTVCTTCSCRICLSILTAIQSLTVTILRLAVLYVLHRLAVLYVLHRLAVLYVLHRLAVLYVLHRLAVLYVLHRLAVLYVLHLINAYFTFVAGRVDAKTLSKQFKAAEKQAVRRNQVSCLSINSILMVWYS